MAQDSGKGAAVARMAAAVCMALVALAPAGAQTIHGKVTDPASGSVVAEALVIMVNDAGERVATVLSSSDISLDIFLQPDPVALDSLTVASTRNTPDAGRLRGLLVPERRRGTLVGRLTRAEIESRGPRGDLIGLLATMNIPGLRARRYALSTGAPETGVCVELGRNRSVLAKTGSRLTGASDPLGFATQEDIEARADACAMMAVYVDDFPISDPANFLAAITPTDLERIEVLPPLEALARYGARAANGALMLWTTKERRD